MLKNKNLERFKWNPGNVKILGICHLCKNKFNHKLGCEAFPDEIPMEFLLGEKEHIKVHPKQKNNIVFESIEEIK